LKNRAFINGRQVFGIEHIYATYLEAGGLLGCY